MKTISVFQKVRHVDAVWKSHVSVSGWANPWARSNPLVTNLTNVAVFGGHQDTLFRSHLVRHLDIWLVGRHLDTTFGRDVRA